MHGPFPLACEDVEALVALYSVQRRLPLCRSRYLFGLRTGL
jgi:hypothetical protein